MIMMKVVMPLVMMMLVMIMIRIMIIMMMIIVSKFQLNKPSSQYMSALQDFIYFLKTNCYTFHSFCAIYGIPITHAMAWARPKLFPMTML